MNEHAKRAISRDRIAYLLRLWRVRSRVLNAQVPCLSLSTDVAISDVREELRNERDIQRPLVKLGIAR